MKSFFDRENIQPDLPAVILLSHGDLAMGMLDTIRIVVGESRNVAAFSLEPGDDPEEYRAVVLEALGAYPKGAAIFIDMFGGSPCNQMLLASQQTKWPYIAFTGMSLPLLSEAISARMSGGLEEIREAVNGIIPYTVMDLLETIRQLEEEDE